MLAIALKPNYCETCCTSWPSASARHSGVRTTSIYPLPKMLPDRALGYSSPADYEQATMQEVAVA